MTVSEALRRLQQNATFTPEVQGSDVASALADDVAELIESYPGIASLSDYLRFLADTGGAHISSETFSLVLYGFGGYVVPSFHEGYFIDNDRFFLFGEVIYPQAPEDPPVFLAFDVQSGGDQVWIVRDESGDYRAWADSFCALLMNFAVGKYPDYPSDGPK